MLKEFPAMVCGVVVALLLITTLAIPVISTTQDSEDVENPDEHGIVLGRMTSNFALDMSFADNGDDTITVDGETYDIGPMILLATDDLLIFIDENGTTTVLGNVSGEKTMYTVEEFTAEIDTEQNKLIVTDTDSNTEVKFPVPTTYLYYPDEDGEFSSWTEGNLAKTDASPVISVGSFAGVGCYYKNDRTPPLMQNFDGLMTANAVYTPTLIESVTFVPTPSETPDDQVLTIQPFDPSVIDFDPVIIDPLNPIDIGGGENVIMAVPTPTYTDGDWGFDAVQGNAIIVSYSGAGGGAITIPATVTSGGNTIPVKQVGKGSSGATVFDTSLTATDLIISEGITEINTSAFRGCTGFTGTLTIPSTVTRINGNAFQSCSGFTTLSIPSTVTNIGQDAFRGCTGFTGTLTIPSSMTSINSGSFAGCTGFTTLSIPSSIKTFGSSCFEGCTGFTGTLAFSSTVTGIGDSAFKGCTGFTSLVLSENITSIGSSVFSDCSGLTGTLMIPSSVTSIGTYAFFNCTGLSGPLVIPSTVTSVSNYSFRNCSGLTGLVIEGEPTIHATSFQGDTLIKEVLNLGSLDVTTTSYGLNADEVRQGDEAIIESSSYIAQMKIEHPVDTTITTILNIVPILLIAGIILAVTGFVLYRRF